MTIKLWSDGPSSQFKNRFMVKFLQISQKRYSATFHWNFFATAHGKGAIEGLGGTIKRMAWRKVKSRECLIRDAKEFYEAVRESSIECKYFSEDQIKADYDSLFSYEVSQASKVEGIKSSHHWVVCQSGFCMNQLTNDANGNESSNKYEIGGWVIISYDQNLYPGIITEFEDNEARVSCLEKLPGGPNWRWPKRVDNIFHSLDNIVRKIQKPTISGTGTRQYYTLEI